MSYFADLDLRLRTDGLDPATIVKPACRDCGGPTSVMAYEHGRVTFSCRSAVCLENRRAALEGKP